IAHVFDGFAHDKKKKEWGGIRKLYVMAGQLHNVSYAMRPVWAVTAPVALLFFDKHTTLRLVAQTASVRILRKIAHSLTRILGTNWLYHVTTKHPYGYSRAWSLSGNGLACIPVPTILFISF